MAQPVRIEGGMGTRLVGATWSTDDANRNKFVRLYASGAITKGDCVAIDQGTSTYGYGNHVQASISSTAAIKHAMGVAQETVASGKLVTVQVQGLCTFVKGDESDLAVGALVGVSTISGACMDLDFSDSTDTLALGLCMVDSGADTATHTILLINPFNY